MAVLIVWLPMVYGRMLRQKKSERMKSEFDLKLVRVSLWNWGQNMSVAVEAKINLNATQITTCTAHIIRSHSIRHIAWQCGKSQSTGYALSSQVLVDRPVPAEDKSKTLWAKICYRIQFICICPSKSVGLWLKHMPKWFTCALHPPPTWWISLEFNVSVCLCAERAEMCQAINIYQAWKQQQQQPSSLTKWNVRGTSYVAPYQFDVVNLDVLCPPRRPCSN